MPGSRNAIPVSRSRLSISPEDVPFTGVIGVGLPAGARRGGDRWLVLDAVAGTPSPLADDRHSGRWCTRNIAKRSGGGYGGARMRKSNGYRPQDDGPGNR